ncbi:MAG TPA: hypothetical protein VHK01_06620 [Lacipirellulaceae bacterium]|nr:hypothetical protein [Lacipirellulaceae bacterium]
MPAGPWGLFRYEEAGSGRPKADGPDDANAEQVRRGMAWVFDRYVNDRSLYPLQRGCP